MITVTRWHEIDAGHRVVGQGGKCEKWHGHRYTIHFTLSDTGLNDIGMILDFGVIKDLLCSWLDDNWDHRFLVWEHDPFLRPMQEISPESVVAVPFNPTAENMAQYLAEVVAPVVLEDTGCLVSEVRVEETRKCSATAYVCEEDQHA